MQIFDTHAHLGLIYSDPVDQMRVVQEARQASVTRIMSVTNNLYDFEKVYQTLKTSRGVYHAVGVSPSAVENPGQNWEKRMSDFLKLPNVIAIGETGLDYYKKFGDKRSQIELFITQLDMAAKYKKPVIVHNREARTDVLDVLRDRISDAGGIFHCYSEDYEFAESALDLPMYFSFAGTLTYRQAINLHDTVKKLPIERLLVESESPFMPPASYRKQRTKPSFILETIQYMAKLRNLSTEEMAEQLWKNSNAAFGLTE